jgi:hypothetical protein
VSSDPREPAKRIPMINGDEYDALTAAKRYYHWRPGDRKRIKRGYQRRFRQSVRVAMRDADQAG